MQKIPKECHDPHRKVVEVQLMLGWGTFFPLGLDINRLILLPKEICLVIQAMERRFSENLGPNSINSPVCSHWI